TSSVPRAWNRAARSAATCSSWPASPWSASAWAISAWRRRRRRAASAIGHAPGGEPLGLEGEIGDGAAQPGQRLGHPVLLLELAVEQHVAATSGPGHLAAQRPRLAGLGVGLVDEAGADLGRHPFLLIPGLVQQRTELARAPPHQRVLHLR